MGCVERRSPSMIPTQGKPLENTQMEADVGTENSGLPRAVQLHIASLESHVSGLTQQLAIEAKIHEAHAARYEKLKARQETQTRTASRLHARVGGWACEPSVPTQSFRPTWLSRLLR